MPIPLQYDLFLPIETETDLIRQELESVRDSQDRQRKSLFAKHGELAKLYLKQEQRADMQDVTISNLRKEIEILRNMILQRVK